MSRIRVEEKEGETPSCPHCEAELRTVWVRRLDSEFGNRYIYFCPNCRKALGVSHRKGFWMG